ncbi:MAG: hypothetical protein JWM76_400 [Pseudonocardiales bacterium]|nr:hypothetical protein [Pseudonocardiales bacterium]
MPNNSEWIKAVRNSHDRFTALVQPLNADEVAAPSYASEWSIAQVASHLGSQAEIFELFLEAGLSGTPTPGGDVFGPIWDRWNALSGEQQVTESVRADEALVTRLEQIPDSVRESFALSMFGSELDLDGLAAMRLGEHALHTWDIAVALDPTATVSPDAVDLLIDRLPQTAARAGKPIAEADATEIDTTAPERHFVLNTAPEVALVAGEPATSDSLTLPAEAFVRLVYGRLDPDHTPPWVEADARIDALRTVFPGF